MPRMRRSARERRKRPQLDAGIWRWIEAGRPDKAELPIRTRMAVFLLEGPPVHKWACARDPNYHSNRTGLFWEGVAQKVRRGDIEVAEDVEHKIGDPSLITELEALKFEAIT
jgi:hypothetical protein